MKNILLPTDFSENSWNAIQYAVEFFKDDVVHFHLFNAYTPVVYDITYVLITPAQFGLGDPIKYDAEENLKDLKSRIIAEFGENPNHSFDLVARFETLIYGIQEMIDERDIDLIVMGTKGATGAKELLFGSNTVQVFNKVTCPIMAIPSGYKFTNTQNILFPTDLRVEVKTSQFHMLKNIASLHSAKINALHVSTGNELEALQIKNKNDLETVFNRISYEYHESAAQDVVDAVNKYIQTHPINLLAMINNKRSFFENIFFKNTINQIGLHLNLPFLVIPSHLS